MNNLQEYLLFLKEHNKKIEDYEREREIKKESINKDGKNDGK